MGTKQLVIIGRPSHSAQIHQNKYVNRDWLWAEDWTDTQVLSSRAFSFQTSCNHSILQIEINAEKY